MIQGKGRDGAEIMLVGDFAEKEDVTHGFALSGYQEKTLRELFRLNNFSLDNCYRTLYIKDTLTTFGRSKKKKKEAIDEAQTRAGGADYDAILKEEILTFQPNVIMPLGDLSLTYLTGFKPISSYRGSILPLSPLIQQHIPNKCIRVIPAFSPFHLLINYTSRICTKLDFGKAVRNREVTGPLEQDYTVWVCRTAQALEQFLSRQVNARFMTFDIETYVGVPTCISFCFDGKESISIPLLDERIDFANRYLMYHMIAKVLNSKVPKVNQNIKYDWTILERFGFPVQHIVGDTTLSFHLLYPELPKNLGFQNSIYTDIPYFKDESKKQEGDTWNPKTYTRDTLYLYNAKDALSTWQIHDKQEEELAEVGLDKLYKERIMPLFFIYKEIDSLGVRIDTKRKDQLNVKYTAMYELTVDNFRSKFERDQLEALGLYNDPENKYKKQGKLIYEVLKFPLRYKTTPAGIKAYRVDKDTLDELLLMEETSNRYRAEGREIISLLIAMRKIQNVLKYINTPLHPGDIWKCNYNLSGTETGRTSASKTLDEAFVLTEEGLEKERLGRSLQTIGKHGFEVDGESYETFGDRNIGKDLRSMFVPRRGKIFIEGDLSQADTRTVAVLAEDYELLASLDQKPKIHAKTAGAIFNMDPNLITKEGPVIPGVGIPYYDLGKRARHAWSFKMGAFRLGQMTHLPLKTCELIMKKLYEISPKVVDVFHFQIDSVLRKTLKLKTPFGRYRQFFDRYSDKMLKEALAYIPQSVTSDALKFGMIPLFEECKSYASFVVEAHDSLLAEVNIAEKERYGAVFKQCIEQPIDFNNCSLPRDFQLTIPCELSIGENWMEMKDFKL